MEAETAQDKAAQRNTVTGVYYALAAYLAWGLLPLYWKALEGVSGMEILAHRIGWSFLFVMMIIFATGQWKTMKSAIGKRENWFTLITGSLLISANWFIYIWAVNNGHMVEASLGYYINPLLNVATGVLFLKERLNRGQIAAIGLAAVGVLFLTAQFGQVPWIALSLAITFTLYGLAKKKVSFEPLIGLAVETAMVTPLALLYLLYLHGQGVDAFSGGTALARTLLMGAGVVTAMPLLWFAQGARRIPLSTIGFIQYLSPTMSLLLGIFLYHEPFTNVHAVSFTLIWSALVIYSLSHLKGMREARRAAAG
ncbi:EamA family transporter RarD [Heliobacterium gestii]|uniref:EamA family transporter RarD n=1 Tax=Heliomicrobium gestii TaxID=2699 RepID=A0A845LF67_HELGE|nr:EamA family transporter RarD [Heliomicrobium gestii]MBM7867819.1 chloramphenicol-sensitive protein RarD [Heliomicrobium gestii]MZP44211.1 EamA family transporter RarD [Heliomicrobium gestii]